MYLTASGEGQPVVLLHGFPGGSRDWAPVAALLSQTRRVVVPDLLGFGRSPRPRTHAELWADRQAQALLEALDREGVETFAIVGHDFGGPVALEVVRRAPSRVTHILLSATNALPDTPIPFPLSAVTWPVVGEVAARLLMSRVALRTMARRAASDGARPFENDAGEARSVRIIFATSLRRLSELWAPIADVLPSLRVPATIVWGDEDPLFPLDRARATAERIAGSTLVVLAGVGHFPHVERPAEFAAAIEELLGSRSTRPH